MPWCEGCSRFWNPSSVDADGRCPDCGRALPAARSGAGGAPPPPPPQASGTTEVNPALAQVLGDGSEEVRHRMPWHFWLLLVALIVYLGWRGAQGIGWIAERFGG